VAWEAAWEEQEVAWEKLTWEVVAWEVAAEWEEQEETAWEEVAAWEEEAALTRITGETTLLRVQGREQSCCIWSRKCHLCWARESTAQ
jgi:hypothetical protein